MSGKSRLIDLLLCLFLGWIGAHRFYEGKTTTAIIYAVTGGIFTIGWFTDLLLIIFGWSVDKEGLPIKIWRKQHDVE